MDDRDRIIAWIADGECRRMAGKVVRELQGITKGMQSGDDSGLTNLWDEVCVQVQNDTSATWDYYLDVMSAMIEKQVQILSAELTKAIWLQTEKGSDWASERNYEYEQRVEDSTRAETLAEALSILHESG